MRARIAYGAAVSRLEACVLASSAAMLVACSAGDGRRSSLGEVESEPQRIGDPERGYAALLNEGYVGCGVPYEAYARAFPPAGTAERLPGRSGRNDTLPYYFTAFTTEAGVEVVSPNCLQCHAETLAGELVLGLGNHTADYTFDTATQVILSGALVSDPQAKIEWERWKDRMVAIAPYIITRTIGVNPADNLAAALFAHRDRDTLAWSDEALLELPSPVVVPVDVPPLWNLRKKNALYATAGGRGDHARIIMTASTLCVDSVDQAAAIDRYFPDIYAYLLTLEAPAYPWEVDGDLAERGRVLFESTCSVCHGTYGPDGAYPNLVVGVDEVGTDPTMAVGAAQFADRFLDWFNESFYGELGRLAPAEGYIAPPLDGIWASAPYFHNGSVPTLELVIDADSRPTYFTRSYDTLDYDRDALGWPYVALESGQDAPPPGVAMNEIYDTSKVGYSNQGHTFGSRLPGQERRALLEYLKTL